MAEVKWIKVTTDIFDDEKILLIESMPEADAILVIWFKLLTLTGKINQSGLVIFNSKMPYTEEMLSTVFRRPLNIVRLALNVFEQFGMIEIINDTIAISNWEKHQNVDGLDKIREQTRERVAKHRSKQKQIDCNVTSNVTVTDGNATDKEEDIDKDIYIKKTSKRFVPPTVDEVEAYIKEKGYHFDAEEFVAFYESKGWMIGKNKMKSWKSACVTWEKNAKNKPTQQYKQEEVKPKRYREFEPEKPVEAVQMPDDIREQIRKIF